MRVKIIKTFHSDVLVGMEGEAVERKDLEGWEVTFPKLHRENAVRKDIETDLTIFCIESEFKKI